ncbi:methyltransferase [Yeosuana sp. MJ-SS3]|uniref:Methyltransferase n=1 Tax=Gilvirhabdus luticola TaxID=3079858 RepID=A0ABU3UA45_9FLAO|nr:methyltransferase [Yeosuana sp. MJ-SS3]MDU8887186.1 methyltransferase [Yeosuana sp. MJ-SS3]
MKLLEKQLWHFLSLALLLLGIYVTLKIDKEILFGSLWNVKTKAWFLWAVSIPIVHQVYVLICWRSELYYNSLTKIIGKHAFKIYLIDFFILFAIRIVFLIFLANSNRYTFNLNNYVKSVLIFIISVISIYAFYSVKRYFGFKRAAGLDHFDVEVRKLPLVKKGIFKYTRNGMYTYAFLAFYLPGLFYESKAAILVALFSHIYIWVHYYFTEKPDMNYIYQNKY